MGGFLQRKRCPLCAEKRTGTCEQNGVIPPKSRAGIEFKLLPFLGGAHIDTGFRLRGLTGGLGTRCAGARGAGRGFPMPGKCFKGLGPGRHSICIPGKRGEIVDAL